jgi:hypothetical protein
MVGQHRLYHHGSPGGVYGAATVRRSTRSSSGSTNRRRSLALRVGTPTNAAWRTSRCSGAPHGQSVDSSSPMSCRSGPWARRDQADMALATEPTARYGWVDSHRRIAAAVAAPTPGTTVRRGTGQVSSLRRDKWARTAPGRLRGIALSGRHHGRSMPAAPGRARAAGGGSTTAGPLPGSIPTGSHDPVGDYVDHHRERLRFSFVGPDTLLTLVVNATLRVGRARRESSCPRGHSPSTRGRPKRRGAQGTTSVALSPYRPVGQTCRDRLAVQPATGMRRKAFLTSGRRRQRQGVGVELRSPLRPSCRIRLHRAVYEIPVGCLAEPDS